MAPTSKINPPSIISDLVVGETRIRDGDGFCGTVVYVGPVASAKKETEVYAGIVWDDPTRGKHDGSVICRRTQQLVRHFTTSTTQGSFLRLSKLDLGQALTHDLLRSKYVALQAPMLAPNNVLPHTACTSSGRDNKVIELVGEMKIRTQQQLQDIDKISLRREGISRAGMVENDTIHGKEGEENEEYRTNLKSVDLAGNLLSSWKEVIQIMYQFPNLNDFSVAYNRIRDWTTTTNSIIPRLERLTCLNLNSCSIQSFATIRTIGQAMPNLESLCVASANLSDIMEVDCDGSSSFFPSVTLLDCSDCQLTQWETQVTRLFATFPRVEQLSLDDNPIPRVGVSCSGAKGEQKRPTTTKNDGDSTGVDPSAGYPLKSLQMSGTLIADWSDLEGINSFQHLSSLRLTRTPLTSSLGRGEVRFLCVARFPGLEYVNASAVSQQERTEAERRYVSLVTNQILQSQLSSAETTATEKKEECCGDDDAALKLSDEHKKQHPQYERLRELHKALVVTLSSASGPVFSGGTLASTICNVKITSQVASSCGMEPLLKRLPGSLTIGRLKALCGRAFLGLDVDLITLHFRTTQDAFPLELDHDENTLQYYGVPSDGAEILMNEIDLDAQRREAERLAEAHDEKVAQQEAELAALQKLKLQSSKNTQR